MQKLILKNPKVKSASFIRVRLSDGRVVIPFVSNDADTTAEVLRMASINYERATGRKLQAAAWHFKSV